MYDEKPLQNFEEGGKNFLNNLWLLCGRQTTTGKRGETERQVEDYCSHHLRGDGSSGHRVPIDKQISDTRNNSSKRDLP